ncbi:uncharacterized protein LOC128965909 [Oppia nitens]|uniref:uncharacterized protein LOC128965909 n=1 Tax=Oppia nitens TaxID=1686743 RepID=UPI0023DC2FCE|nr:uncharacterized protein LOC128965909 [Oppia nitens]
MQIIFLFILLTPVFGTFCPNLPPKWADGRHRVIDIETGVSVVFEKHMFWLNKEPKPMSSFFPQLKRIDAVLLLEDGSTCFPSRCSSLYLFEGHRIWTYNWFHLWHISNRFPNAIDLRVIRHDFPQVIESAFNDNNFVYLLSENIYFRIPRLLFPNRLKPEDLTPMILDKECLRSESMIGLSSSLDDILESVGNDSQIRNVTNRRNVGQESTEPSIVTRNVEQSDAKDKDPKESGTEPSVVTRETTMEQSIVKVEQSEDQIRNAIKDSEFVFEFETHSRTEPSVVTIEIKTAKIQNASNYEESGTEPSVDKQKETIETTTETQVSEESGKVMTDVMSAQTVVMLVLVTVLTVALILAVTATYRRRRHQREYNVLN